MRLSTKSEYAFLALLECTRAYHEDRRIKIGEISVNRKIPKKYLENILLQMKQAGLIKTKRGSGGGIMLGRKPSEITLAEVVRLMDGAIAPTLSVSTFFYEATPLQQSPEFIDFFREIRNDISEKMETTTIEDLSPNE